MKIIIRRLVLALTVLGLGMVTTVQTAKADTTTDDLPASYQRAWYGYLGSARRHHVRYYYTCKLTLFKDRFELNLGITTHADLTHVTSVATKKAFVTYQKKVSKKQRVYYKSRSIPDGYDTGEFKLTTIKLKGIETPVISWNHSDEVYAFKTPKRAEAWGTYIESSSELMLM
jgi:hypothetical protein